MQTRVYPLEHPIMPRPVHKKIAPNGLFKKLQDDLDKQLAECRQNEMKTN